MGNSRKASKTVFTIFIVILSISILFNVLRLIQSVNYYNQCQPQYVAVSQVDYDEANYLHIGALKNPVDETSVIIDISKYHFAQAYEVQNYAKVQKCKTPLISYHSVFALVIAAKCL